MKKSVVFFFLIAGLLFIIESCTSSSEEEEFFPVVVNDFETTIDETPTNGTLLGKIDASTESGDLNFSLISQSTVGAIEVAASSGEISVVNSCAFIFSNNSQITGVVSVSNGFDTDEANITININDPGSSDLTIWTGDKITFTKADGADPSMETNQDRITENVWITRGNDGGQIYNAKVETWSDDIKSTAPADTEWALGTTSDIKCLSFAKFRDVVSPQSVVGKELVLHLVTDDIYIDIEFTQWSQGKVGGFAYERSTEPN